MSMREYTAHRRCAVATIRVAGIRVEKSIATVVVDPPNKAVKAAFRATQRSSAPTPATRRCRPVGGLLPITLWQWVHTRPFRQKLLEAVRIRRHVALRRYLLLHRQEHCSQQSAATGRWCSPQQPHRRGAWCSSLVPIHGANPVSGRAAVVAVPIATAAVRGYDGASPSVET